MATDNERMLVIIEAKLRQFEREMAKARGEVNRTTRHIEGRFAAAQSKLLAFGKGFAGAVALGFATVGLAQLTSAIGDTVKAADTLVDTADKIGLTVEALQALRYQAEQNGSTVEEMDRALEEFNKRVGIAATGTGNLLKIFEANGIALRDLAGNLRDPMDLLRDYADLIKNASSEQDAAVLATEAFGRAGEAAAFALRGGSEEITKYVAEAENLGIILRDKAARELAAFSDEIDELKSRWNTFWSEAVVTGLQALEKIGEIEHAIVDGINKMFDSGVDAEAAGRAAGERIAGGIEATLSSDAVKSRISGAFAAATGLDLRKTGPTIIPSRARPASTAAADRAARDAERALNNAREAELQRLEVQIGNSQDALREFGDIGESVFSGFVSDIQAGATAAEALTNTLRNVASQLLSIATNKIFGALFGGGLSPGAAALGSSGFAGLFAGGGRIPGGQWGIVGERGPEVVRGPAQITPMSGGGGQQVVRHIIEVHEGPMFRPTIRQESGRTTAQGLAQYDRGKQREQLRAG